MSLFLWRLQFKTDFFRIIIHVHVIDDNNNKIKCHFFFDVYNLKLIFSNNYSYTRNPL